MGWTKKLMVAALLVALAGTATVSAEDGWDVSVGAGVVGAPVYEGAREYYASPVPTIDVSWTSGGFSVSASLLDGLGVSYLHEGSGVLAMASLNTGESRTRDEYSLFVVPVEHSASTQRLLEDSPDANGLLAADATLGYITPVGLIGATAGYRPTVLDDPQNAGSNETYHGFIYSLLYMIGLPVTERIEVSAVALLEAMDGRYADSWYEVETETPALESFEADRGLHRAELVLESTGMITDRFGLSLLASQRVLLADAAGSPFTEQRFQTSVVLTSFYRFR